MATPDNYQWLPPAKRQRVLPPTAEPEESKRLFIPDDIDTLYGTPVIQSERQQSLAGPSSKMVTAFSDSAGTFHATLVRHDHQDWQNLSRMQLTQPKQPFIPDDIDTFFGKPATQNPTRQLPQVMKMFRAPPLSKKRKGKSKGASKGARPYIPDDIEAFYRMSDPPECHQPPCTGDADLRISSTLPKEPPPNANRAVLPRGVSTRIVASSCDDTDHQHFDTGATDTIDYAKVMSKVLCARCGQRLRGERLKQHGEFYHSCCLDQSQPWEYADEAAESLSTHPAGIARPWLWMQTGLGSAGV